MMKHRISVSALTRGYTATPAMKRLIKEAVSAALAADGVAIPCLVAVHTTNDADIRWLNRDSRGVDKPTDVLSFPMFELEAGQQPKPEAWELEEGRAFLGDIVISLERAAAQAVEYEHSYERETAFLAVHAALHLLGYDHERSKEDEKLHFTKQEVVLKDMGVSREE